MPAPATPDVPPGTDRQLLDAVTALSSDLDLHRVLTRLVESARALTGARHCVLGILGPDDVVVELLTSGQTPHEPPITAVLGVPVHIRGTVFGHLSLSAQAGGAFTEDDEHLVLALADAAGRVIENARAYGLSERRRRWLEEAAALTDALQPPVRLERALAQIGSAARRLGQAWAVGVVSPDAADLLALACEPRDAEHARELMAGAPAYDGEPLDVRVGDAVATVIPLPVRLADGATLIALYDAETARAREPDERELLISFADHAALALDRASAVRDQELLAVVAERERIARELHDTVIQRLFAVGMQLQAVSIVEGEDLAARLQTTVRAVDDTIRDIRVTIFDLQGRPGAS